MARRRAGRVLATWWRTALAAAVAALAAAVGVGVSGSAAQADATPFVDGTGTAVSQAFAVAPTTASLGYTITFGQSIADFEDNEGQAQSQTLNLGTIGVTLTSTQCNGAAPTVQRSSLPPPAQAESTTQNESQDLTLTQGFDGGSGAGAEHAAATTVPTATATTDLVTFSVPGGLELDGGRSSAEAQIVGGQTRQTEATADVSSLSIGGGLVVLNGLHWDALQRTGAQPTQSGTFSLTSVTVGGQTLPVATDGLAQAFAIVNTALAPTGLHLTPPETETLSDGSVEETPLAVGIDNSALGQEVVGSQLGTVEPLRDALDAAIIGQSCTYGTELTLGDIGLGVLSGGGDLDLDIGGASAVTNGTAYADPFGSAGLTSGAVGAEGTAGGDDTAGGVGGLGSGGLGSDTGGLTGGSTPGEAGSSGTAGGPEALRTVGRTVACRSSAGGGCAPDDPLPVGLASLGAVMAFGVTDFARLRRRRPVSEEPA